MVLLERIELSASPLPRVCSTTELQQLETIGQPWTANAGRRERARLTGRLALVNHFRPLQAVAMDDRKLTREERLAAKLRENLRLRKAQARALVDGPGGGDAGAPEAAPLPNPEHRR